MRFDSSLRRAFLALALLALPGGLHGESRRPFDLERDILIAQFDGRPDADDVHAQAALGCLLQHPDFKKLRVYAVMNAFGNQKGKHTWDSTPLMNLMLGAEGEEHWTNANHEQSQENWSRSVNRVVAKVAPVLKSGGDVWIQEGGQSDLTRDWLEKLIRDGGGISASDIKERVHLVQHSDWNEKFTSPAALAYVKARTDYVKIASGNTGIGSRGREVTGPIYKTRKMDPGELAAHRKLLSEAQSPANPNRITREIWQITTKLIGSWSAGYSPIGDPAKDGQGGLDFSDFAETAWILGLGSCAGSIEAFWNNFVITPMRP